MINDYPIESTESICVLIDFIQDIKNTISMMLEEIEDNAPLKRYHFMDEDTITAKKHAWSNRSEYIHAMTIALGTMITELETSVIELDKVCNPSEYKAGRQLTND